MNTKQINVGGIPVDVIFKKIKNVHLSVHPPTGRVRISAPKWMNIDTIRVFAISNSFDISPALPRLNTACTR